MTADLNNKYLIGGPQVPDTIIIHWIGAFPGQVPQDSIDWWNRQSEKGIYVSAHYLIKNDTVVHYIPENRIAYHSGDSRNTNSIGIEVFPKDLAGLFSDTTIETIKRTIDDIKNRWTIKVIERHFDGVQKKDCPRAYTPYVEGGDERWETLKRKLWGL